MTTTTQTTTTQTTETATEAAPHTAGSLETRPTPKTSPRSKRGRPLALALLALGLGACVADGASNGATGGGGAASGAPSKSVEETLGRLGVPLDTSPRLDSNGQAAPGSFDPLCPNPATSGMGGQPAGPPPKTSCLGNNVVVEKKDELFALGMQVDGSDGAGFFTLSGGAAPSWLADVTPQTPPVWALAKNGSIRAATAADVDGDGRQETIVVSTNPQNKDEMDLSIVDDAKSATPFAVKTTTLAPQAGVLGLALAAADFDGDGKIDLAIAVSSAATLAPSPAASSVTRAEAQLLFYRGNGDGTFTPDTANTKTLVPASAAGPTQVAIVLAPAELDGDGPSELALVVNDTFGTNSNPSYTAHYYVYDDATTGYAARTDGAVGAATDPVVAADLAAGDVDGDGLDELVLGGPDAIAAGCSAQVVAVALDDAAHSFAPIGLPHTFQEHWGNCGGDGVNDPTIAWAPVRVLQADANNTAKEILIGDTLFANLSGAFTLPSYPNVDAFNQIGMLPSDVYISSSNTASNRFNPTTAAVVIAAVQQSASQPGASDEVLVYTQDGSAIASYLPTCASGTCAFPNSPLPSLSTTFAGASANGPTYPILVPADITGETVVLQRADASHQLVFTQPMVIAAMAAAPCENGIGQNTDACVTTYGVATSQGQGQEQDTSESVGITAGIHVDGAIIGDIDVKATVTETATQSTAGSYTLTQQITYSSGSMEDSVVFATVPYDQYHYTVVSGGQIGSQLTVSVPRAPVVLIAERGFYNSTVIPGGLQIDSKVFRHKIGDLTTYPTQGDEQALAGDIGGVLPGKQGGAAGQGTGSTTISDAVERDSTVSTAVEFGAELDVEATAGVVMAGFSVGTDQTDTLSVTMGENTSFSGTVGSIDAEHFSANFYQFNIFAYTQADPTTGQQFQVVNYWVQQ